jgi:hypothetical protein
MPKAPWSLRGHGAIIAQAHARANADTRAYGNRPTLRAGIKPACSPGAARKSNAVCLQAQVLSGVQHGSLDFARAVAESFGQGLAMLDSSWPLSAWHSADSTERVVPSDASARQGQKNTTSAARIEAGRLR